MMLLVFLLLQIFFLSVFFFLDMLMWTDFHLLKYDRQGRAPLERVGVHFRLMEGVFIS